MKAIKVKAGSLFSISAWLILLGILLGLWDYIKYNSNGPTIGHINLVVVEIDPTLSLIGMFLIGFGIILFLVAIFLAIVGFIKKLIRRKDKEEE